MSTKKSLPNVAVSEQTLAKLKRIKSQRMCGTLKNTVAVLAMEEAARLAGDKAGKVG